MGRICMRKSSDKLSKLIQILTPIAESSDWYAMIENITDQVRDALEKKDYWRSLTRMDDLQWNDPGKVRLGIDLEQHRKGLVREMLQLIKSGEMLIPYGAAKCMLDNMDVTWPELDVIRRSTYNDLTKNVDPQPDIFEQEGITEYPYPIGEILGRMDIGNPRGLYHGIQALRYDGVKDSIILGAMKPYDERLADWLDMVLTAARDHRDWVTQAVDLMMMGADWPHVKAVIEKHRGLIIRYLLQEYKSILDSNDWVAVKMSKLAGRLDLIRKAGYDWPELRTIEKSIEAGHK